MDKNQVLNKNVIKHDATDKEIESLSIKADELIKKYSFGSSLTGFIPFPLLDTIGMISVQRTMLFRLSQLYNVEFSKSLAKVRLTTLTSSVALRSASPVLGSALKVIPGVGTLIGGASMAALGGATTYAAGKIFQKHFEKGGTLENFDSEKEKNAFNEELKKAKQLSKSTKE